MRFGLDLDRMVAFWSVGEEDLAMAFLGMEGFEIAHANNAGNVPKQRTLDGWEVRIVYVSKRREAVRLRHRARAAESMATE